MALNDDEEEEEEEDKQQGVAKSLLALLSMHFCACPRSKRTNSMGLPTQRI